MAIYVIYAILCGGLSAVIAIMKERNVGLFFLYGLLFGVLGLAYASFAANDAEHRRSL